MTPPHPSPLRGVALDHVVLRVRDLDRCLAFYRDLLGLLIEGEADLAAGNRSFVSARIGGSLIDLVPDPAFVGPAAGLDHLCLAIETADLTAAKAWLESHGVTVERGPVTVQGARGAGRALYIRDPDGYQLELKLYPSETRPPVGG